MIAWYLVTSGFVDPAGLSTATGVMAYVDSTFSVLPGGEATAAVGLVSASVLAIGAWLAFRFLRRL